MAKQGEIKTLHTYNENRDFKSNQLFTAAECGLVYM
jgi:hypothetical protein